MKLTSREKGWAIVVAVVVTVLLFGDWLDKAVLAALAVLIFRKRR